MSAREEIARLLFITDNRNAADPEHEWEMLTRHGPKYVQYVYEMADALIAAGYTNEGAQPRTQKIEPAATPQETRGRPVPTPSPTHHPATPQEEEETPKHHPHKV